MATKVETRMQVQSKTTSQSNDDASVILNMDDVKRNKNASKRNSSNISGKSESYSLFYEASLILENVKPNQSGNYTCGPSNSLSASVRLHITQGRVNLIINVL